MTIRRSRYVLSSSGVWNVVPRHAHRNTRVPRAAVGPYMSRRLLDPLSGPLSTDARLKTHECGSVFCEGATGEEFYQLEGLDLNPPGPR
jgi:hypothetical protein